jgi:PPK2 family polyphosphate:nucleotide phosphotransferase
MKQKQRIDPAPFLVKPGTKVRLKDHDPAFTGGFEDKAAAHEALADSVSALAAAQELLWASKEYSVIIIFQALDAAGKDGTIKHVMSGVNPQGVEVHSFKAPSDEERLHHFLWRPAQVTPARGRIAIFNRSYYEEVLVVRVHPELLHKQWLPHELRGKDLSEVWQSRYEDINAFERTGTRNNVCVIKFFLNVSRKEQKKRFLERLSHPEKYWKFSSADLRERSFWDDYADAYQDMLAATSTQSAPWYVVPANKKWFTRACVAGIIADRIGGLGLKTPEVSDKELEALKEAKRQLEHED